MKRLLALAAVSVLAVGVFAGQAPADSFSGTVSNGDPTQTNRVIRNTVASTCAAPKTFPGEAAVGTSPHFEAVTVANVTGTTQCVSASLTVPGASALFVVVYCPAAFNPANIATNYFADPGFSASAGSTATFSFTMAAGAVCLFIVSEVDAGSCGDAGCAYTLNWTFAPVAATFRSLSAVSTARGALVRWRTASEVDALGFNVYRSVHGRRVRVNAHLIPAHGAGAYSFLDRLAPRAKSLRYWVQLVNVDGSRRWYGPSRVARP